MKTKTKPIDPQDVLCAIFVMSQRTGPFEERDLRVQFGASEARISRALSALRRQGLVQDDAPRLTFVGLAAALQILPTSTWALESERAVA